MANKYKKLINQIEKVILELDKRLVQEPDRKILNTLFDRYTKANEILKSNGDINQIMIKGGFRAYLDSYSDYMNPLLAEIDKAERLLKEIQSRES